MCVQICRLVGGSFFVIVQICSRSGFGGKRKPNYPLKLKIIADGFVKNTFNSVIVGGVGGSGGCVIKKRLKREVFAGACITFYGKAA